VNFKTRGAASRSVNVSIVKRVGFCCYFNSWHVASRQHQEVIPHAPGSRNSLDGKYGIYRIPSDRPGATDFQQPLNYRSIARSFNRIFTCYHVHSPSEAATKTCLSCIFHGTNLPELGHIPRRARLTSEAQALIPTGRLGSGCSCLSRSA
jgi:hypothetical protein